MTSLSKRLATAAVPFVVVLAGTGTAHAAKPVKTPPPVLTQKPTSPSTSRTATFAWTAAANTTYTCSLDGARAVACTTPTVYNNLTDRTHSFALKATQSGGKPASIKYTWVVDATPPAAPTINPLPNPTSSTSASVSWSDADASVTGYTCSLDGALATACTSPLSLTSLTEASHTITVTAHDAAGNTASSSRSWVVDHTAPNVPIVVPPASPTNSTSASIDFSGEVGSTFTCALDGVDRGACTSPVSLTGLSEGSHTFTVTPIDAASNVGQPGSATWMVDLTPPATPLLVNGPPSLTNQTDVTVDFTEIDVTTAGFTCALDGAAAAPCTSPYTNAGPLSETSHSLVVRAVDAAGNPSSPLTVTWAVDTTAPSTVVFVSGPDSPTRVAVPVFDFTDTDSTAVIFQCSLDDAAYATCLPGDTYPAQADGSHTFRVQAGDNATTPNWSVPSTWSWVVDTTAPATPTAVGPTDFGAVKTVPSLGFSSADSGVAGFTCAVDGAAAAACASGFTPVVSDGAHTVVVKAVDTAGNASTAGRTFTFTLDTVAPTATLTLPANVVTPLVATFTEDVTGALGKLTLAVSGGAAVPVTASCRNAAAAPVTCSGPVRAVVLQPVKPLLPGQRYFAALAAGASDAAGNTSGEKNSSFRAQLIQQESSSALAQSWRVVPASGAYGSRYVIADLGGASASYVFNGTSITWYSVKGASMGTARVYVDGVAKGIVNNYSATTTYHVARTLGGLTAGAHTLKVVATGAKGATRGTGTGLAVDAVKVGATLLTNPITVNRWAVAPNPSASAGSYAVEDLANATTVMTFRGTSVSWTTITGTTMGKAQVYVDGVLKGTYDNYAASTHFGVKRTWALTDKVHTIKIVVLGTHRAGGKGNRVVLDAITIG